MAKATLATNFADDILNTSMNGKRRYRMINNSDGTVSFEDVTTYNQLGSDYGASQINQLNTAVNQSFDASKIIKDKSTLLATQVTGYVPDATLVKESVDSGVYFGSSTSSANNAEHRLPVDGKVGFEFTDSWNYNTNTPTELKVFLTKKYKEMLFASVVRTGASMMAVLVNPYLPSGWSDTYGQFFTCNLMLASGSLLKGTSINGTLQFMFVGILDEG